MRGRVFIVSVLLATSLVFAQDAGNPKKTIYISATTKENQPVTLRAEDCHAAGGIAVGEVTSLGDTPISYIIAVDTSNSVRQRFMAGINISKLLLTQVVRPNVDKGVLVGFDAVSQMSEVSTDPNEVMKDLDSFKPGGASALFDAMYISTKKLGDNTSPSQPRVMFLITDGDDNHSKIGWSEVLEVLIQAGVRVYPIWVSDHSPDMDRGGRLLTALAEKTGGVLLEPNWKGKFLDMKKPAELLRGDLSSWHRVELTLLSPEKPGSLHNIGLRCGEKKMQLRAVESYVAGE